MWNDLSFALSTFVKLSNPPIKYGKRGYSHEIEQKFCYRTYVEWMWTITLTSEGVIALHDAVHMSAKNLSTLYVNDVLHHGLWCLKIYCTKIWTCFQPVFLHNGKITFSTNAIGIHLKGNLSQRFVLEVCVFIYSEIFGKSVQTPWKKARHKEECLN